MTVVVRTRAELDALPSAPRAVVMTMGALHDGHLELTRRAREIVGEDGLVMVTVFVNPLQFGPKEDFDRYPRQLQADVEACAGVGVDVVFAPSVDEMYPDGASQTTVVPGPLADQLEGALRPGHFAGVLTVVLKLLNLTAADHALFGEKDYQQLVLIRQMVRDLNVPVQVVGVETQREADGLARSSRNVYLDAEQRAAAAAIPRCLRAAAEVAEQGGDSAQVLAAANAELGELVVDYLELRAADLTPAVGAGEERLLVAVRLGATRLLDNGPIVWRA